MNRSNLVFTLSVVSFVALGAAAQAETRAPRKPPQEAFDACKSAKQGDACTVSMRDHEVSGTCEAFGTEGLACRPSGPPPGPPPQAVEACSQKKEGDDCTVEFEDAELDGQCTKMKDVVACLPDDMPAPPSGSSTESAGVQRR